MGTPEEDAAAAAAAFLAQTGGGGGGGGGGAKKKNKKKNKKKAEGGDGESPPEPPKAEGAAEGEQGADAKGKGKKKEAPKKPVSAAARLALERLQREKEEAERIAREEEELRKQEEEEERQRLEAERLEAERKERKKQKEKEKKERLRAEGKAVTKAEKAREAKARAAREKLIAQGLIQVDEDGNIIDAPKPKQVDYSQRKKKTVDEEKEKARLEEEAARKKKEAEEERKKKEEEEAARKKKEEEQAAAAALAAAEKEEEAPAVLASWDASDDEWDKLDEKLDQLQAKLEDNEEVVIDEDIQTAKASNQQTTGGAGKKKGGKKGKKKGKKAKEEEEEDDDSESEGRLTGADLVRQKMLEKEEAIEAARERREERLKEALKKRTKDDLRSPICCVMGHVDTGKTKLLDKIRRTNVQEGEAGGITQQIGATYFPMENLRKTTDKLNKDLQLEYKIPGLLVIDTPGHESFANLRKRGSSTADIAILVIDIMHGLEQQTIESINLLRMKKTPFIVALNKVDRLYGWKPIEGSPIRESLGKQDENVHSEFEMRTKQVIGQLMEQGLNAALYYNNKDYRNVVSLVPTSAHSGEGIPDLLLLLVQLTQRMMVGRLMFSEEMEGTVLDVKKIEGIGTTIDVLLINGKLKRSDTIVVAGMNGPIVTQIRALLTPQPLKEMRVKGDFVHHEEIKAALGVKIAAQHLEDAIAGTSLMVVTEDDDIEELKEAVMEDVAEVMGNVSVTGRGVCVQASTLGSLEALMEFLRTSNIPVASVAIGPVHKRDVSRASIMLEHQKEYACILAFDVKVSREAQEHADDLGVRIFTAEIIYHLFDHFTQYLKEVREERRSEIEAEAVFPCVLRIIPENVFMKKNPLLFGVEVLDGICKVGTPVVVPDKLVPDEENPGQSKMLELGKIVSVQKDGTDVNSVKKGSSVCIKIQGTAAQSYVTYGRHFDHNNLLYSKLTRKSIDLLKENFRDDLQKTDWQLVIKLKGIFDIV